MGRYPQGAASDREGLLAFDTNGDGFLTELDSLFDSCLLWNDKNSNGRSDADELVTLSEAGVASINLEVFDRMNLDTSSQTSQVLGGAAVSFLDGRQVTAYDVAPEVVVQEALSRGCSFSAFVLSDVIA